MVVLCVARYYFHKVKCFVWRKREVLDFIQWQNWNIRLTLTGRIPQALGSIPQITERPTQEFPRCGNQVSHPGPSWTSYLEPWTWVFVKLGWHVCMLFQLFSFSFLLFTAILSFFLFIKTMLLRISADPYLEPLTQNHNTSWWSFFRSVGLKTVQNGRWHGHTWRYFANLELFLGLCTLFEPSKSGDVFLLLILIIIMLRAVVISTWLKFTL